MSAPLSINTHCWSACYIKASFKERRHFALPIYPVFNIIDAYSRFCVLYRLRLVLIKHALLYGSSLYWRNVIEKVSIMVNVVCKCSAVIVCPSLCHRY